MKKNKIGSDAETFVCNYLISKNWIILERNWFCRGGEIDIIAKNGEEYVFVEVRCKKKNSSIKPIETVTYGKQNRILKSIEQYIYDNNIRDFYRCDFVGVEYIKHNDEILYNIESHIENIELC